MTVLAKVLGAQVCKLIFCLDVVDADLTLLHQLLHEKVPQRDMICARTVCAVAGDVQHRHVVDVQRHAAKLSSKPSSNITLEQNTASFIVRAVATSSASIVGCAVSSYSAILKLIGALAGIAMCDDVNQPALVGVVAPVSNREGSKRETGLLVPDGEVCGPSQVAN